MLVYQRVNQFLLVSSVLWPDTPSVVGSVGNSPIFRWNPSGAGDRLTPLVGICVDRSHPQKSGGSASICLLFGFLHVFFKRYFVRFTLRQTNTHQLGLFRDYPKSNPNGFISIILIKQVQMMELSRKYSPVNGHDSLEPIEDGGTNPIYVWPIPLGLREYPHNSYGPKYGTFT